MRFRIAASLSVVLPFVRTSVEFLYERWKAIDKSPGPELETAPATPKGLREIRQLRSMSLNELARRVDLSQQTISRFETGLQRLSEGSVFKLCEALGCQPNDLLRVDR